MTEVEKIQGFITKFQGIIDGTDMDICQSRKGRWYFSRYNDQYKYYECFREFDTADELAQIMLGELTFDMYYYIEKADEVKIPEYIHENICDMIEANIDYSDCIKNLWEALQELEELHA